MGSKEAKSERRRIAKLIYDHAQDRAGAIPAWLEKRTVANHGFPSTYIRYNYYAETTGQLSDSLGVFGEAGVAMVRWDALASWISPMHSGERHPLASSYAAVRRCRDEDLYRLGLPTTNGARRTSAFNDLSPDDRCEAVRLSIEAMTAWEDAGSPGLTPARLKQTQQIVCSVVAMAEALANPQPKPNQENNDTASIDQS